MTHITVMLARATEARARHIRELIGRPVEELACLAVAEAMHEFCARDPATDPGAPFGQLHPLLLTAEIG